MGHLWSRNTLFLDRIIQNGKTLARHDRSSEFKHDRGETIPLLTSTRQSFACSRRKELRRGQGRVAHRNSKTQTGSFIIHFALFWAPILALFGVILWVRAISIRYIQDQRSLDRCIHSVLKTRCVALNTLSATNLKLIELLHAAAAAEASRRVVSLIPAVGTAANAAITASIEASRAAAQMIARSQDAVIAFEELSSLTIWHCGPVFQGASPLVFTRPATAESLTVKMVAPLKWDEGPVASELQVKSWNLKVQSFGHCFTSETKTLEGEHYEVSFQHAKENVAKSLSSQWFF
jgi:hypothetical protein